MPPQTCALGFKLAFNKDVTKKDYIEICQRITDELIEADSATNIVSIVPEPITEGGLLFRFDQAGDGWYKSMRHRNDTQWPWITPNVIDEWKDSSDIIFEKGNTSQTMLKAFNGAPVWTLGELQVIKTCLQDYGIRCQKLPAKKSLSFDTPSD